MPPRTPKACRRQGCRHTSIHASGYCPSHEKEAGRTCWQPGRDRHQRGYGVLWDKLRARIKVRDKGLCRLCLRDGRAVSGSTTDHIRPKSQGGTDDPANLQLLCLPCHRHKTATERRRTATERCRR